MGQILNAYMQSYTTVYEFCHRSHAYKSCTREIEDNGHVPVFCGSSYLHVRHTGGMNFFLLDVSVPVAHVAAVLSP